MSGPVMPPSAPPPPSAPAAGGVVTLIVGLLIGVGFGAGLGYSMFHKAATATPSGTTGGAHPTLAVPTFSFPAFPSDTSAPSPSSSSSAASSTGQVVSCPPTVPSGQHALGTVGTGPSGSTAGPSLLFCGQGSVTVPESGTFTTGDSWGIGYSHSCPTGTAPGGMGTAITISEQNQDGSPGPDSEADGAGDWGSQESNLFATGGTYQLQVSAVDPNCVWELQVYTT